MRLLLDEMWPPTTAEILREQFDVDARHVRDVGLGGADDPTVAQVARSVARALVTENVADFALERDLVVVCVLKRNLPPAPTLASALAHLLHDWIDATPDPYLGQHWP